MFVIKKIVTFFLNPFQLGMVLCLFGLLLLWGFSRRREKQGRLLVTAGILWMAFFGMDPVAKALMGPLEDPFRPVEPFTIEEGKPVPKFVVILAGGHRADPELPVTSHLRSPAIHRLIEGIRLHRKIPQSKLVLSGGIVSYGKRECETMKALALELGVEETDIILEGESRDTRSQAVQLTPLLKEKPFLLVSSANHLQRAVARFEAQGLKPIATPAIFITTQEDPDNFWVPFPNPGSVWTSYRALHERVGRLWGRLRG